AQHHRVLNGIRTAFYEVLADQRLIDVHRELLRNAEEAVRTTEELVNVGQANRADLLQARIEAQRARVDLRTAENNHQRSWEHLIALVGTPDLPRRPLAARLESEGRALQWQQALARLLQESPELQIAPAEVVRHEIALRPAL